MKKYTNEVLIEIGKQFQNVKEWRETDPNSYAAAFSRGILKECTKHMTPLCKPPWTREELIKDAKKYSSKVEWQKKSSGYTAARKMGILDECCVHMNVLYKNHTDESIINNARTCSNRDEWRKKYSSEYSLARQRGIFNKCIEHMKYIGHEIERLVYVYEFSDKTVYVGLTYHEPTRKYDHLKSKKKYNSFVYKHIEKTNLQPIYKRITDDYVPADVAQKIETETIKKYRDNEWNILNKTENSHSLGGNAMHYTEEFCINDAKKYNSRGEWKRNSPSAYSAARKKKILDKCCSHMVISHQTRPVWRLDVNGKEEKYYKSISEASRDVGVSVSRIVVCVKNKKHCKTAGGYKWKYADIII